MQKMLCPLTFSFETYRVDTARSIISFTYRVAFRHGISKTFTDRLYLKDVPSDLWKAIPPQVLEPTLQALHLMIGINYWSAFPARTIHIKNFALTREQADFWNALYLNGLAEFFYDMQMDFRDLISFPYNDAYVAPTAIPFERPQRTLLLNGAGKDSILSAEMLKSANIPFDFFAFSPTPAHKRIAALVGAKTMRVERKRDANLERIVSLLNISSAYPSVSTFTFVATLLAELIGYDSIVFSNERSADFGNLTYLGLSVNHQWCKSSEAERMINDYIQRYITPSISTHSLLRELSELEIVRRFVEYPKYLPYVTSCNSYFWLPRSWQLLSRKGYWCKRCPKCVFLFASYAAFLPKTQVTKMFGADLYAKKKLLPLVRRILGTEGFKPLDCVGEPEEMILAMEYGRRGGEYADEPAMSLFEEEFPPDYDFRALETRVFP